MTSFCAESCGNLSQLQRRPNEVFREATSLLPLWQQFIKDKHWHWYTVGSSRCSAYVQAPNACHCSLSNSSRTRLWVCTPLLYDFHFNSIHTKLGSSSSGESPLKSISDAFSSPSQKPSKRPSSLVSPKRGILALRRFVLPLSNFWGILEYLREVMVAYYKVLVFD